MLKSPLTLALVVCLASVVIAAQQPNTQSGLRIVVIAGEGAVNIIQQKTAVAPIIEVRDRNNLPVSGATVTFSLSGSGATFGSGSTMTVVTNAAGQATAAGLTPTAAGALQVNVSAAFQGQMATAAITQTNFATAQAAAAAGAGAGSGSGASGAAGAGAGAGGGGGIGLGTIGLIGGAVAGGAVVATQTNLLTGDPGFIHILGTVYARGTFGVFAQPCAGVFIAQGTGATCYLDPLGGALVATSLDGATTTTGADGSFDLTTTISRDHIEDCRSYTITISAPGHPTYSVGWSGFSGNRQGNESKTMFILSPPTPSIILGC